MEPGDVLLKRLNEVSEKHPERWSQTTSGMFRLKQTRPIHIGQVTRKDNVAYIEIYLFENHELTQKIHIYKDTQSELYDKYVAFLLKISDLVNSNLYGFFVNSIQETI